MPSCRKFQSRSAAALGHRFKNGLALHILEVAPSKGCCALEVLDCGPSHRHRSAGADFGGLESLVHDRFQQHVAQGPDIALSHGERLPKQFDGSG